jgi:hypothetical protein
MLKQHFAPLKRYLLMRTLHLDPRTLHLDPRTLHLDPRALHLNLGTLQINPRTLCSYVKASYLAGTGLPPNSNRSFRLR